MGINLISNILKQLFESLIMIEFKYEIVTLKKVRNAGVHGESVNVAVILIGTTQKL